MAQCQYLAAPIYAGSPESRDTIMAQDVFRDAFRRIEKNELAVLSVGDVTKRSMLVRYGLPEDVGIKELRAAAPSATSLASSSTIAAALSTIRSIAAPSHCRCTTYRAFRPSSSRPAGRTRLAPSRPSCAGASVRCSCATNRLRGPQRRCGGELTAAALALTRTNRGGA